MQSNYLQEEGRLYVKTFSLALCRCRYVLYLPPRSRFIDFNHSSYFLYDIFSIPTLLKQYPCLQPYPLFIYSPRIWYHISCQVTSLVPSTSFIVSYSTPSSDRHPCIILALSSSRRHTPWDVCSFPSLRYLAFVCSASRHHCCEELWYEERLLRLAVGVAGVPLKSQSDQDIDQIRGLLDIPYMVYSGSAVWFEIERKLGSHVCIQTHTYSNRFPPP